MGHVRFTANLQRHLACPPRSHAGGTLRQALDGVFAENPRLRSYILDEQGRLRRHVIIYVNERPLVDRLALSDPIDVSDEVFVFQALSGG